MYIYQYELYFQKTMQLERLQQQPKFDKVIPILNNKGFQMAKTSPLLQEWINSFDGQNTLVDLGCAYGINTYEALDLNIPVIAHTVQPNRTLYRIHHISDRQWEGLLRTKFVMYGTPFQHIFNYLKISSIIWRYILYLQIFEDIFNSYEYIFK